MKTFMRLFQTYPLFGASVGKVNFFKTVKRFFSFVLLLGDWETRFLLLVNSHLINVY